jgi:peptidoglycan/xylan/chitin deacetylase (PgdA/CDA1 family)
VRSVAFDIDDFSDRWNCLQELMRLRERYPRFKTTLFTIPYKTDEALTDTVKRFPWIELAVHGFTHEPNDEMLHLRENEIAHSLAVIDGKTYVKGFKSPGWYISASVVNACNEKGYWVAMREEDRPFAAQCKHGYYIAGEKYDYWHGHSHNVCNNGLRECLHDLLRLWPREQEFKFVSEAVVR